jgi:hypothetical protein
MRKLKNPIESTALAGGKLRYRKLKREIVLVNRPDYKMDQPVGKQKVVQQKFRQAAHYANLQLANEESRGRYEKKISEKKKTARIVAMTDFLTPPEVTNIDALLYIGAVGNPIKVLADDDFEVTGVKIVITDSEGTVLESGDAQPDPVTLLQWNYAATVANPELKGTTIQAIAFDRPGNTGQMQIVL